jgi:uncharacterized protein (TIGR02145 family)
MRITYRFLAAAIIAAVIFTTSCQPTDYSADINALKASRDSLAAALKVTNANLQSTNNALATLTTTVTSIQTQLAVISGQISTLNTQLTATNATVAGHTTTIAAVQSQIKTIQDQITALNAQQIATSTTVSSLSTTVASIQTQINSILSQVATLNTQQTATSKSLADLSTALASSNKQLSILSLQFDALLTQLGLVIDIEGNIYHTVTIGTQVWMVENLKTTKFRNGDPIPYFTQSYDKGYCWYGDDINNKNPYGAIYNYYTAMDSRSICPIGWHVPTLNEWTTLSNFLGGNSVSGGKLKEVGNAHWAIPNIGATNDYGFSALPAGVKDCSSSFIYKGTKCQFWVSSPVVLGSVNVISIFQSNTQLVVENIFNCNNVSVRCIKD